MFSSFNKIKWSKNPQKIYSRQGDISKIINSKRIWGQTEGSVYGLSSLSFFPQIRATIGKMSDKEDIGMVIFTGDAAKLFKPHEVEGFWSGGKNLLGQYKAGFGDIQLDNLIVKEINDIKTLFVNKVTLLTKDFAGQTQSKALRKLWGRRLLIEPIPLYAALTVPSTIKFFHSLLTPKVVQPNQNPSDK